MFGGLVGDWRTTSFETTAQAPPFEAKGTERFSGCLDRRRDRSCAGDPSGTLSFSFLQWAKYDPGGPGVVTFVDTPTRHGVRTVYIGNVTLARSRARQSRARGARIARAAPLRTCAGRL